MELTSKRLNLREITVEAVDNIHQLHSNPEVDEYNTLGIPKDLEETKKLVLMAIEVQNKSPRTAYEWVIELKDTHEFLGLAGMFLSNDKYRLGEIYYKFFPRFWGNGFATEVAQVLVKADFGNFNLHKVEAGVAVGNDRSVRVLEKIGMTREGLRRKILPIRGKWVDNYHFPIVFIFKFRIQN